MNSLCLKLTLFIGVFVTVSAIVTRPPEILNQPDQLVSYAIGESIELPCEARGEPKPTFMWQKDGEKFDVSGNDNRVTQQPNRGTIVINEPLKKDEGVYQCFASNGFGTAVTQKAILKTGKLDDFPLVVRPIEHTVNVGESVELVCSPPFSSPPADIYWYSVVPGRPARQLPLSNRISMDLYGNLFFTNVLKSDQLPPGGKYQCAAYNRIVRQEVRGDDQTLKVEGDTPTSHAPELFERTLNVKPVATAGTRFVLKCVFAGAPTPKVTWKRKDKALPTTIRIVTDSFGQELIFDPVLIGDAGDYECEGTNDLSPNPSTKPFKLSVESKPYWVKKPSNAERAENESAIFECEADGTPRPDIKWFINGQPISKVPSANRFELNKNTLQFVNLTIRDAQVIQCNASNNHGYIFANAKLNVLSIKPEFKVPPPRNAYFAEGSRANITCETYAAPKAVVTWIKDGHHLTGGRYKVHKDGNLEIMSVISTDAGKYQCIAKNMFGSINASGHVVVRQATRIVRVPQGLMINAGTEAKLVCTATTDPELLEDLQIDWLKDRAPINYQVNQRIFQNILDNSLTITDASKMDTAVYTCVAKTPLDEATANALLTVRDRPNAPSNVEVDCSEKKSENIAIIRFSPSGANYAPILGFEIQYNTTYTPDTWSTAKRITGKVDQVEFKMSPGTTYSFRAIAQNRIGFSEPSSPTAERCKTDVAPPDKVPTNVKVEGTSPTNLVIEWTKMAPVDYNAPAFKYSVSYECVDPECTDADGKNIYKGRLVVAELEKHSVVIENQLTYKKYEVVVTCENEEGSTTATAVPVFGYSGENFPVVQPDPPTVVQSSTNGAVAFKWKAVPNDPKVVMGRLVGYLLMYYKKQEGPRRMIETLVKVNEPVTTKRKKRAANVILSNGEVTAEVTDLPPYSRVVVKVAIVNDRYQGIPSKALEIDTEEGVPGPVSRFLVRRRNSNMLEFKWDAPSDPNGVIVGYNLAYRTVDGLNLGDRSWMDPINDPEQRSANISGLKPEQLYRIYIYARTKIGRGDVNFVDERTTSASPPSPPTFIVPVVEETSMNVTWEPSRSGNPGSVFYVQYRKTGRPQWETTAVETVNKWVNVTGLRQGTEYEVRVVSRNGIDQEAPSDSQFIVTKGYSASRALVFTQVWFILMVLSVLLLIILFIVIMVIRKRITPRYPEPAPSLRSHETERLHLPPGDQKFQSEYATNPAYQRSQDNIDKPPLPPAAPHYRYEHEPRYGYAGDDRERDPMRQYREPREKSLDGPTAASTFV